MLLFPFTSCCFLLLHPEFLSLSLSFIVTLGLAAEPDYPGGLVTGGRNKVN
jgi:hypothetical protein